MKTWIASTLLALPLAAPVAHAAPHVWLDTDRGPVVPELDPVRAPATSAHFLDMVGDGFYDGLVFHRTIKDFVIQAGRMDGEAKLRTRSPNPSVPSERGNGLTHVPGAISIALPSATNGIPLYDAGTTEFFIDTANNTNLDGQYTVFGHVVHGMPVVEAIGDGVTYSSQMPFRPALIRRAVASEGFPVMPLHSGAWYDPANSGRGISLEVSTVGGDGTPLMVAYWYDYQGGRQVWMNGAAPFQYGDTEVTINLAITGGGEFGDAYDPALVDVDDGFGTLTVRFSGCEAGSFAYETAFGSGTMELVRITIPDGQSCD